MQVSRDAETLGELAPTVRYAPERAPPLEEPPDAVGHVIRWQLARQFQLLGVTWSTAYYRPQKASAASPAPLRETNRQIERYT